jgi:DNA-binding LytR/AlgR family response regulator
MRARIEKIGPDDPEEVVIRCRDITPEVEALARQINHGNGRERRLAPTFFKDDSQYYLSLKEILFFETDDERVFAHTVNDSYETRMRLYELENMLPRNFLRASKSAIVNVQHVLSIQKGLTRVCLVAFRKSHKTIYCSRQYSQQLIEKMEERVSYENV